MLASFGRIFATQVGPGTVFEPSYLRKSYFSRNITFSNGFGTKLTPRWSQDRTKIAPRRVQDRLGLFVLPLDFSLRFLILLGSVLVPFWTPKWSPGGRLSYANRPLGGPRRSWDRLGSTLFSSCGLGSLFWPSWAPLGVVLGRFWTCFGPSWALVGAFWGSPGAVLVLLRAYLLLSVVVLAALDAHMLYDDQHHFLFPSSFPLPPLSSSSLPSSSSFSVVIVEAPVLWSLPPHPFPLPLPTGLFDHRYRVIALVRTSRLRSSSVFPHQSSKRAIPRHRSSEAST